ncbi:hypothetical protein V8E51_001521 [Hyaloscypha variabilis]
MAARIRERLVALEEEGVGRVVPRERRISSIEVRFPSDSNGVKGENGRGDGERGA